MDHERLVEFFEKSIPFNAHLGLTIEHLEEGFCRVRIPFRKEWIGDPYRPALHGGIASSMIDAAGGLAVFTTLDVASGISTVDLRVDYLRPGLLEDMICEAKVVRAGNRVAVTSMRVLQGPDCAYLTAEGRAVYNVLRPEKM